MNNIHAADIGFGVTKGMASNGKVVEFPSVIGDYHPVPFVSGLGQDIISNLAIETNGKRLFLGKAALKQSKPQATIDKDRTVNEEGIALCLGALALLADNITETLNLVVGLPVMHYEGLKAKYVSALKGVHFVNVLSLTGERIYSRNLSIEDVRVLPQPMGTFCDCAFSDNGENANLNMGDQNIGIIDIGYNTADLARIDQFDFVGHLSTSFSGFGIFSAFQILSKEIYRNLGVEIQPEYIEPIVASQEIKIKGRMVPIEPLIQNAMGEMARQIISRTKSCWQDHWNIDKIIISGGGAYLLGKYIIEEFQNAVLAPNPKFANVSGYLKYGKRKWEA